ncbi:hypothetical protein [Comamonas odontotermitis]|uniref:hypothetical protein n=1 Tax=Comamonas TaxID=283 RepID=UPI00374FF51A
MEVGEKLAQQSNSEQLRELEARVLSWKKWVAGIAVCLVGAYLIYFGLILGQNPATDSDKWGAFGDFLGGLMNPIVAFAAFFWLTESVKIQKQELVNTRDELAKATEAQNLLVWNGRESVRLAAVTALANAASMAIDRLDNSITLYEIEKPSEFSSSAAEGIKRDNLIAKISTLRHEKKTLEAERDAYLNEMKELLNAHHLSKKD